ncbi:MAG: EAL domain-containing protein [Holosporaceae bacterium]|nr:EAL domain-containing protein [Holosporaceae bacterium]
MDRIRLQPLVGLGDGSVFGYEALYRKGDAAEYPSAHHILQSIFSNAGECSTLGRRDFRLFINMTPKDLEDDSFCHHLFRVMDENGINGRNIVLEVSENTSPEAIGQVKKTLNLLRRRRIRIALDDFGTKYSGMDFMSELPVDIVKIDKKFVQSAPSSKKARTLLKFMSQVSHDIGCRVVAEGIETLQQLECVKESNIDVGQGFLFTTVPSAPDQKTSIFIGLREFPSFISQKIGPRMMGVLPSLS